MDPAKIKAAMEAIKNQDGEAALALLESFLTDEAAEMGGDAGTPPDGAATADTGDTGKPAAGTPAALSVDTAAASMLMRVTGTTDLAGAEASLRAVVANASETVATRNAVDLAARRELIGELIALGVETPNTAWDGKPELLVPKKRFEAETVADLRARVANLKATRGVKQGVRTPPAAGSVVGAELDVEAAVRALKPSELAACKKNGLEPAEYVRRKAAAVRTL